VSLLVIRLVLLGGAAAAVVAALLAGGAPQGGQPGAARSTVAVSRSVHACPMHPQVVAPGPGDCPICGMALEPREPAAAATGGAGPAAGPARAALSLAEPGTLRAFDAVSRVKRYDISLEMRGLAWADSGAGGVALYHRDEAALVKAGESGLFYPAGGGAAALAVRVTAEAPEPWDGATVLVRFRADGAAGLVPGVTGSLKLATRLRHDLVVREGALLRSPEGPYVLVVSPDRRMLTPRPVQIGNVVYGYATVVGGLREDEIVAAKRTFFLDSERRRAGAEAL
jgi:hypothetical protein